MTVLFLSGLIAGVISLKEYDSFSEFLCRWGYLAFILWLIKIIIF